MFLETVYIPSTDLCFKQIKQNRQNVLMKICQKKTNWAKHLDFIVLRVFKCVCMAVSIDVDDVKGNYIVPEVVAQCRSS